VGSHDLAQPPLVADLALHRFLRAGCPRADNGTFDVAEQVTDPGQIVLANYWRDVALHHAIPFEDYMRRSQLRRAS